jgi:hypothetical protein
MTFFINLDFAIAREISDCENNDPRIRNSGFDSK